MPIILYIHENAAAKIVVHSTFYNFKAQKEEKSLSVIEWTTQEQTTLLQEQERQKCD